MKNESLNTRVSGTMALMLPILTKLQPKSGLHLPGQNGWSVFSVLTSKPLANVVVMYASLPAPPEVVYSWRRPGSDSENTCPPE